MNSKLNFFYVILFSLFNIICISGQENNLKINNLDYYEVPSLNVMMFDDFYPDGHQGGLSIIQFGKRLVSNGDIRLEATPGQWSPIPKVGKRIVDKENGIITVDLSYPDSSKHRKGFNPIEYPDLVFEYQIRTEAIGNKIKLTVDLKSPLPDEWAGKVGFNLEIFPGDYFGEHYLMDDKSGIFPQQANGPMITDADGNLQIEKLASGKQLVIAPGIIEKQIRFETRTGELQLIDGRGLHNNGWFILRSTIPKGATKNAVEWIITPSIDTSWRYKPVVQISQVGYHPEQIKFAVIELDKLIEQFDTIQLIRINVDTQVIAKEEVSPVLWGEFLRYKYLRFDFSDIKKEGLYLIKYGDILSNRFEIKKDVFARHVWQPSLEFFLPVQMCHMRIIEKYRVWHGLCHMDDARMAPINHNHFDGYLQGESTLSNFNSGDRVPGLNVGGWHDAGDYDLRVESQAGTVYNLALAYELFGDDIDETTINQETRNVEIHKPDGKADILQQIEHGALSIVGAYESLNRLYRGIICPTLEQYVLLGDGSTMTDNFPYKEYANDPILKLPLPEDDRWVFTEENPRRELQVAQNLAAASRALKSYNSTLSAKCLKVSEEVFVRNDSAKVELKINCAAELYLSTSNDKYANLLFENIDVISDKLSNYSIVLGRFVQKSKNNEFNNKINIAVKNEFEKIVQQQSENPYGVPYKPYIWGAGWGIQAFGIKILFLHLGFPDIVNSEYVFNALNFVLGCHPGENTASFASGVGANSLTVAYGVNRAEWSYIPGGVASGTALIRPDLPELKVWPFFWQQTEYVIGGGATNYMILAMAADYIFNGKE
jgi:endoglucanase